MNTSHPFPPVTHHRNGFLISTDPDLLDIDIIHDFLANEAYWCPGIAREKVTRFTNYSLCFGIYDEREDARKQVGFGRIITDYTTFAYVADVFILRPYRGQGLGKWLLQSMLAHPQLQELRRWMLHTKDAHTLYQRYGFETEAQPENCLILRP